MFQRLHACEQNHRVISHTIDSWRAAFSIVGNPSVTRQVQDASEQMQISPMGAEGSNVMPGQPARADAADTRKDAVQSNLLLHLRRDGTPHAGSTAGEATRHSNALKTATAQPFGELPQACNANQEPSGKGIAQYPPASIYNNQRHCIAMMLLRSCSMVHTCTSCPLHKVELPSWILMDYSPDWRAQVEEHSGMQATVRMWLAKIP